MGWIRRHYWLFVGLGVLLLPLASVMAWLSFLEFGRRPFDVAAKTPLGDSVTQYNRCNASLRC